MSEQISSIVVEQTVIMVTYNKCFSVTQNINAYINVLTSQ